MEQQSPTPEQPNSPPEASVAENDSMIDPPQENKDYTEPLPDDLLLRVLSFLPTEDAVRTSVLSSRWERLWTYVWNLEFRSRERSQQDFISFVDNSLRGHEGSKIVKLCLEFFYEKDFNLHVGKWISIAISKKVEKLHLNFSGLRMHANLSYSLPGDFYKNDSFRELQLTRCTIRLSGSIHWRLLVKLSLRLTKLSDDAMNAIFSGCPLLEDLALVQCLGLKVLNVSVPNVKSLTLDPFGIDLSIFAPSLRSLTVFGSLTFASYSALNFSSLKDARLDCGFLLSHMDEFEDPLILGEFTKILENINKAEVLTVGYECIKVLTMCTLKVLPISNSKRTCLIFETALQKWELPGIYKVLRSSPDLEILIIRMKPSRDIQFDRLLSDTYTFNEENFWVLCKVSFSCLMHRLKIVEIHSCLGWYTSLKSKCKWMTAGWLRQKCKIELELAVFLLKNAAVLKRLNIYFDKKQNTGVPEVEGLISEMSRALLLSPKASPFVEILVS